MSTTLTAPSWTTQRPWRNSNPGDLRVRHQPPPWPGQTAIDDPLALHGGPFAIFASRPDGWAAVGLWLLLAHDEWGWTTVRKMISAFAPPQDNNDTNAYIDLVCSRLRVTPDTPVNPHDRVVREALMRAIALAEAGARVQWPAAEVQSALMLTEARWDAFLAAYKGHGAATAPATHPVPPVAAAAPPPAAGESEADELNQQQIDLHKGETA